MQLIKHFYARSEDMKEFLFCFQGLYFYREIGDVLTPHFPRCVEKVVFINVPALFKLAYLFLSKENQECINIFGRDRSSWEQMLLNYIDRHQIPEGLLQDEITRL